MTSMVFSRPSVLSVLLLLAALAPTAEPLQRAKPGGLPILPPSANADRRGSYESATGTAGYAYWVHVPASYDPQQPVGLVLFFHGQNGQGGAKNPWGVGRDLLEAYNLILINMQYADGDNAKDTAGKVESAKVALAQVMADYPVVPGRGMIASFSGGGMPHSLLLAQLGLGTLQDRGYDWPFCQSALLSSNFRADISGAIPMTWQICVGENEWGLANLGPDASTRTGELARLAAKGESPDFAFRVEAGKDHTVSDGDRQAAKQRFLRADLMLAPFVRPADVPQKELIPALRACLSLQYGKALEEVGKVLTKLNDQSDPSLKPTAERLHTILTRRSEALAAMLTDLAAQDPLLALWYGRLALTNHLKGHPAAAGLKELLDRTAKDDATQRLAKAATWWYGVCDRLVSGGRLAPDQREAVEKIHVAVLPTSTIGVWSGELLLVK